jgi:single-strand DNA-binding protein
MSFNTIPITVIGNLTDAPELRFTPAGVAVCKFTVASTPRVRKGDQWEDGEPTFMPCTAWRQLAENAAESLPKGTRVVVTGRLRTERWETKEGEKRSRVVLDVDAVGPDLTYATADVRKMVRHQGDPNDPWATASKTRPAEPAMAGAPSGPVSEEPPF